MSEPEPGKIQAAGVQMTSTADGEGIAVAELDFGRQDTVRRELPVLSHARLP